MYPLKSKFPTPSPAKLAAWARVRAYWIKNKLKLADDGLLELEWVAKNTD